MSHPNIAVRPVSTIELTEIVEQICEGLLASHNVRVVHKGVNDMVVYDNRSFAAGSNLATDESWLAWKDRVEKFGQAFQTSLLQIIFNVGGNNAELRYIYDANNRSARIEIQGFQHLASDDSYLIQLTSPFHILEPVALSGDAVAIKIVEKQYAIALEDMRQQTIRLNKIAAGIVETQSRQVAELTESMIAKQEVYKTKLDDEHRERMQEFNQKRIAFEKEKEAFETRDATWLRRKTTKEMLESLKNKPEVEISDKVIKMRKAISRACGFALLLGFILLCMAAVTIDENFIPSIHRIDYGYFIPGIILISSTLIYYFRWSDQWFRDHADAALRRHEMELDIRRAAWLAELIREDNGEGAKEIPEQILERFSTNLFASESISHSLHPADDLARLMKKATRIKVGRGLIDVRKKSD